MQPGQPPRGLCLLLKSLKLEKTSQIQTGVKTEHSSASSLLQRGLKAVKRPQNGTAFVQGGKKPLPPVLGSFPCKKLRKAPAFLTARGDALGEWKLHTHPQLQIQPGSDATGSDRGHSIDLGNLLMKKESPTSPADGWMGGLEPAGDASPRDTNTSTPSAGAPTSRAHSPSQDHEPPSLAASSRGQGSPAHSDRPQRHPRAVERLGHGRGAKALATSAMPLTRG